MTTLEQDRTLDDLGRRHPDGLRVEHAGVELTVRVESDWRQYRVMEDGTAHLTHNAGGRKR